MNNTIDGFLEIGNGCKKKLPNNFYWKESELHFEIKEYNG